MKQTPTEKILLMIIVGLIIYSLTLTQCTRDEEPYITSKIERIRDTIWQIKIDTLEIQTTTYKTVYVPKIITKETPILIEEDIEENYAFLYDEAREYRDTLRNDDFDIFTRNLIKGELLDGEITYQLKIPREIKVTERLIAPPVQKSALYAFGEVGGNQQQFDNISLGLQYNHKTKWFVSYRSNFNNLHNLTHNIGIGIRLK